MIENVASRRLCTFSFTDTSQMRKNTHPAFCGFMICNENLTISMHKPATISLKQPWLIGFSILEVSKYVVQSALYDVIKPAYKYEIPVLLTDTGETCVDFR